RGLATGNGIYEHGVIDIESEKKITAEIATIYLPKPVNANSLTTEIPLTKGEGQCYRLTDNKNLDYSEVAFNANDTIQTASWKTDAKLAWIAYSEPLFLNSFLLINTTYFKYADLEIKFSSPVSIYLEQDKQRWAGYINKLDIEENTILTYSGLPTVPFIIDEKTIIPKKKGNVYTLQIENSGKITCGLGAPEVLLPRTFIEEYQFLQNNISTKDPNYWSPYEQNRFKEEASRELIEAGEIAARQISRDIFNDPSLINNSINVIQGINQYRYNPVPGGSSLRIPHSYRIEKNLLGNKVIVSEDGHWSNNGMEILDFNIQSTNSNGLETSYRYMNPYKEFYGQQINLNWKRTYGAGFYTYSSFNENYDNFSFHINRANWHITPNLHYTNDRLETASFSSHYSSTYLSIQANSLNHNPVLFQTIKGNPGNKFSYIVYGNQNQQNNTQKY
ncbi:MAG: hypothetical protein KAR38_14015, partial [Calditrichia bacterium]|nr:hypothetical protein [Calditrichia bacterium]